MYRIKLFYNTIKYLKAIQFWARLKLYLPKFFTYSKTIPEIKDVPENFHFIIKKKNNEDFKNFHFLNESKNLKMIGWNNPNVEKLWNYNLHYFNYLLSKKLHSSQIEIVNDWIRNNVYKSSVGLEPYPTSIRIVNWIKWLWRFKIYDKKIHESLWNQVRYLELNIEYHLLGNHLFTNCKALFYACAFFSDKKLKHTYKKAINILNNELDEQFLNDGAHFELSPMYHALSIEDLIDLYAIKEKLPTNFPSEKIKNKIIIGLNWLKYFSYKNSEIANFNDSTNDIAPLESELIHLAKLNKININKTKIETNKYFESSGFYTFNNQNFKIIADVGKIGPDYIPGHSHADTLSFELSIKGTRVIVNSGINTYKLSKERLDQRKTFSHSTVSINNEDSSEVWSSFRVGRRAYPFDFKEEIKKNRVTFSCSHDGFMRLKGKPFHNRKWICEKNMITVIDSIHGEFDSAKSRFYFHPNINVVQHENFLEILNKKTKLCEVHFNEGLNFKLDKSNFFPSFGNSENNFFIEMDYKQDSNHKIQFKLF